VAKEQTWLSGEIARNDRIGDLEAFAVDLAAFLRALQAIDPTGGPVRKLRGGPLHIYDAQTRAAMDCLVPALIARWLLRSGKLR